MARSSLSPTYNLAQKTSSPPSPSNPISRKPNEFHGAKVNKEPIFPRIWKVVKWLIPGYAPYRAIRYCIAPRAAKQPVVNESKPTSRVNESTTLPPSTSEAENFYRQRLTEIQAQSRVDMKRIIAPLENKIESLQSQISDGNQHLQTHIQEEATRLDQMQNQIQNMIENLERQIADNKTKITQMPNFEDRIVKLETQSQQDATRLQEMQKANLKLQELQADIATRLEHIQNANQKTQLEQQKQLQDLALKQRDNVISVQNREITRIANRLPEIATCIDDAINQTGAFKGAKNPESNDQTQENAKQRKLLKDKLNLNSWEDFMRPFKKGRDSEGDTLYDVSSALNHLKHLEIELPRLAQIGRGNAACNRGIRIAQEQLNEYKTENGRFMKSKTTPKFGQLIGAFEDLINKNTSAFEYFADSTNTSKERREQKIQEMLDNAEQIKKDIDFTYEYMSNKHDRANSRLVGNGHPQKAQFEAMYNRYFPEPVVVDLVSSDV